MDDRDGRPSPDALLKAASGARRGRLKIFLGAAPGVGKTYEMLTTARARRRDGIDVVIGIVETHGRAETEALVAGLETIPRRDISYRGHVLGEMDIDGLLARRPALALIDELAHTNAPGSRHPKRYLDVEELLAAGIDVYSTLNIQHVESLNDVVARITRIRVRETVPDSIIDRADEIELVDLTPDDLLQRLREGKIYLPKTASRALGNYFSPGNLTALRELALRRTAQRVDAQLLDHMQAHAIPGPWAAGDRLLVCIGPRRGGAALVRYGRRLSERLRAPWTALHVETARDGALGDAVRDRIADTLRMAEKLGGEAVTIPGGGAAAVAADLLRYAREQNFTHIVIGHAGPGRWWAPFSGAVMRRVIAASGDIPLHIVGLGDAPEVAPGKVAAREEARFGARPYALSLLMVLAAIGIGMALRQTLAVNSISMVFLTAVMASASAFGLFPSLLACLVSVLAYNFFFLPPLYTFVIADPENVVALVFFLIAALIVSNLGAGVRSQAVTARSRARTTEELYGFSRKLAGIVSLDDLLWAAAYQVAAMLKVRVVLLLPEGDAATLDRRLTVRAGYPPEDELDDADLAAAKWCWQHNTAAGRGADTLPGGKRLFLPMRTGRGPVGVVGIDSDRAETGPLLTPDQRRLLDALSDQTAVSIERVTLADDVDRARLTVETERLRSALLNSISHDLRTPLASILGAASSLDRYDSLLDGAARGELVRTIQEEAERLNRFVANLLDMTRLESGVVAPRREPVDIGEVVGSTLARAGKVLASHRVVVAVEPDMPAIEVDAMLLEQVLFNLLDNAARYAPANGAITVRAWPEATFARIQVIDEGPGIPEDALELVFDKFYRVRGGDRQAAGTGLGLAICRGFIEAMGGTITAGNRQDRSGAVLTVTLPPG